MTGVASPAPSLTPACPCPPRIASAVEVLARRIPWLQRIRRQLPDQSLPDQHERHALQRHAAGRVGRCLGLGLPWSLLLGRRGLRALPVGPTKRRDGRMVRPALAVAWAGTTERV